MAADPEPQDVSGSLEAVLLRFTHMLKHVGRSRGLSGADVDELCQEVRIRLWRSLRDGQRIAEARASYVYRTALSAAIDLIRRRRVAEGNGLDRHPETVEERESRAPASDLVLEGADLADRVEAAISRLHGPRDVVVRLHLAGYDRRDIAALLGWSEAKTRNLLYRGLDDLRAALREAGIGPEHAP